MLYLGLLQVVLFTVHQNIALIECVWFCNVTSDLYRETVTQSHLLTERLGSDTVYYFSDPTTVGCFSLSPSLCRFCLYDISTFNISMNGKQDVLKQPEANTDLLYFTALTCYKSSVEKNFPIFAITFSH